MTGDALDNMFRGENGNDVLTGAGGNDMLVGGVGNDKLNGDAGNDSIDGGTGKDAIVGGAGADTLIAGGGADTLTGYLKGGVERDMTANVDVIHLDDTFFAAIGPTLEAGEFVSGAKAAALDANDFLLYDTKTGVLSYDADGNGLGKAVKIATLSNKPQLLDHEDFMIV